jgi:hypothetical protein
MNEKIRELADNAWKCAEHPTIPRDYDIGIFEKKFAELIVLESSKWIVDNSIAMEQLGPEFFAMGLCKHFGIK